MTKVRLDITSGLPFLKIIIIDLPVGRTWWTSTSQFELLLQIREKENRNSRLMLDCSEYLDVSFTGTDQVTVRFEMNGQQTRLLRKSGFYDLIMSDVGTVDDRAYRLFGGQVLRDANITAEIPNVE